MRDFAGHRRREQKRQALLGQIGNELAHILDEAHVEHAVGFVDDERGAFVEAHLFLAHQIEQAARCGDENIDAVAHRFDLLALAHAAKDDGVAQMQMAAIGFQTVTDLHGQFARRREDERAHAVRARDGAVLRKALQQRQSEGGGLAGSGLRQAQHIAAFQDRRNRLALDRRRMGVILGDERAQKRFAHAERLKGHVSHKSSLKPERQNELDARAAVAVFHALWRERNVSMISQPTGAILERRALCAGGKRGPYRL